MFKKIININFVILSLFVINSVYSQSKKTSKSFETRYIETMKLASKQEIFTVNFKQEIYSALRDKVSLSDGVLSIKKPSSFRFEITSPRKEIYLSNGKNFWKYIPELKHAQHLNASSNELGFVQLLTDLSNIKKFYDVSEWKKSEGKKAQQDINTSHVKSDTPPPQNDDDILLRLTPKGDKQQKVLYAVIQVKTGFIQELRIVQLNGNRTRLLFDTYSPKPVSNDLFEFTPPQGIVVDKM